MSETAALFSALRQSADAKVAAAIEHAVQEAPDRRLCRINALDFAARAGLDEERVDRRLPACRPARSVRAVLERPLPGLRRRARRRHLAQDGASTTNYACALCAAGYEPTLDEMVEVTFTVSPPSAPHRRPRSGHAAAGRVLPPDLLELRHRSARHDHFEPAARRASRSTLLELPAGEKAMLSLTAARRIPDRLRSGDARARNSSTSRASRRASGRSLSVVFNKVPAPTTTASSCGRARCA